MTTIEASPPTRVLVLGPVAVAAAGAVQALPGQQGHVLSLLAAAHPNPVSTEALVDELWLDRPPKSARTGLRVVIARLRERINRAEGSVVHDGGSYRLALADDQLDWMTFDRAVDSAEAKLSTTPGEAADELLAALDMWRGDAFQPFGASPALSVHAAHLSERRREAEELLLTALLQAGRAESAATWATHFVESEPYRERRWEHLMLALYRTGRQAEALRAAQRATTLLREELGIEPGPALRQLETDILNQATHLDEADEPSAASEAVTVDDFLSVLQDRTDRIPIVNDSFVGRTREEARLAGLLEDSRLVSIVGPPGVGKTRLAAQHAASVVNDKVVWLDLVPLTSATILPELAGQLGVRLTDRQGSAAAADALTREPTLLVLDNCEHVVAAVAKLAEALLAACPDLTIVATSRTALTSPSETQLAVAPLAADDAIRLLADRSPGGLEAISSRSELATLVEQLDGIPLSVELAAPTLGSAHSPHLSAQLDASLSVAEGHGRLDPRHRSLNLALEWSFDLLGPDDRDLFASLGAMSGTFTAVDVADLTSNRVEDVGGGLTRLATNGLIQATPLADGQSGWRLLNSIRTYARSRLSADGRLTERERAHAEFHVELVESLAEDLIGPNEDVAVARLQRAPDQLRATHRWLIEQGSVERSAAFTLGLWEYSFFRQHYSHYGWLDDTLAMDGAEELPNIDELLAEAALAAWARDRFTASTKLALRAEAKAAVLGRPVPLPALKARFNVAVHENRLSDALWLLETLLSESSEQANPRHHADNLVVLAMGHAQLGAEEEAKAAAEEGMALAVSTDNPTSISWSRVGIGSAELLSDPAEAARSFSAASRLASTVRNHWVQGMAMAGLVCALRRQERIDQARHLLTEVVDLWGRANATGQLWRACQEAILLLAAQGEREPAARLLAHLDLADHAPPMLPDDQARLDIVRDELKRLDVVVYADHVVGLPQLVAAELHR